MRLQVDGSDGVEVEAVEAGDGDTVLGGVPGASKDLLLEVIVGAKRLEVFLGDNLADGLLIEVEFKLNILIARLITNVEVGVEHTSEEVVGVRAGADAELLKDGLVVVELTKFGLERLIDLNGLEGFTSISNIPHLNIEEISSKDVLSVPSEGYIRDGGNNFGEEVLLHLRVLILNCDGGLITETRLSKITKLDDTL
jgi:hypothetical protein